MERGPFLDEQVQRAFGPYVMIELHTDGKAEDQIEHSRRNRALQQELFGTVALPYYVILDPSGERIYWRHGGVVDRETLLRALRLPFSSR